MGHRSMDRAPMADIAEGRRRCLSLLQELTSSARVGSRGVGIQAAFGQHRQVVWSSASFDDVLDGWMDDDERDYCGGGQPRKHVRVALAAPPLGQHQYGNECGCHSHEPYRLPAIVSSARSRTSVAPVIIRSGRPSRGRARRRGRQARSASRPAPAILAGATKHTHSSRRGLWV